MNKLLTNVQSRVIAVSIVIKINTIQTDRLSREQGFFSMIGLITFSNRDSELLLVDKAHREFIIQLLFITRIDGIG